MRESLSGCSIGSGGRWRISLGDRERYSEYAGGEFAGYIGSNIDITELSARKRSVRDCARYKRRLRI